MLLYFNMLIYFFVCIHRLYDQLQQHPQTPTSLDDSANDTTLDITLQNPVTPDNTAADPNSTVATTVNTASTTNKPSRHMSVNSTNVNNTATSTE